MKSIMRTEIPGIMTQNLSLEELSCRLDDLRHKRKKYRPFTKSRNRDENLKPHRKLISTEYQDLKGGDDLHMQKTFFSKSKDYYQNMSQVAFNREHSLDGISFIEDTSPSFNLRRSEIS